MAEFLRQQRHRAFGQGSFTSAGMTSEQDESGVGHIDCFQMIIKVVGFVFKVRKKLYDAESCFLLKLVEREQYGRDSCGWVTLGRRRRFHEGHHARARRGQRRWQA